MLLRDMRGSSGTKTRERYPPDQREAVRLFCGQRWDRPYVLTTRSRQSSDNHIKINRDG
jgi:hypothetical protein